MVRQRVWLCGPDGGHGPVHVGQRPVRYASVRDADVAGRRVFLRADLNVPLKNGKVADDTRITAMLPTLHRLIAGGGIVVLASHLGRPGGRPDPELSLVPVARRISGILGVPVLFAPDCVGERVKSMVAGMRPGQVILLENLRFREGEKANDREFARKLASLVDVYVNDAFATCHRKHASMHGVPEAMGGGYIGMLVEKELSAFEKATTEPEAPVTLLMGGAKVSDKVEVMENLIPRVDNLLVGGAMAFTFLRAKGLEVGRSLLEEDSVDTAGRIMEMAESEGTRLVLPSDVVVAPSAEEPSRATTVDSSEMPEDAAGLDVGERTVEEFDGLIMESGTVIWNGPMGMFEVPPFDKATRAMAESLSRATEKGATTLVGGGDSARAVAEAGRADSVSFVSTGGGASLTLLKGEQLVALHPLSENPPPLRPLIGGNWKMNGDPSHARSFLRSLDEEMVPSEAAEVVLFPSFTLLSELSRPAWETGVQTGAQDIYYELQGAYTGEVSPGMIADAGGCWFLAGHSERRHVLGENDETVARKLEAGLRYGLRGVLCVGELLEEREADRTEEVVRGQVLAALENLDCWNPFNLAIAYEPVWAIGTGKTATAEEANRVHGLIRGWVEELTGTREALSLRIIYGGSVKPKNAFEILSQPHVNGVLVGGASLEAESFMEIIRCSRPFHLRS
ncbi:triose-phosphate isomerase [Candidatus Fermentibacteria bacterium]|nr:triose-phosphate isomerase [Candidatus Fermentibacteria bacterium]